MKGLTITKKTILSGDSNKPAELLQISLLILVAIACLPFIILAWIYMITYNALLNTKDDSRDYNAWYVVNKNTSLVLKQKAISAETISNAAAGWLDNESLVMYCTEPKSSFFEGYFTDFLVERVDGVFVQKVFLNDELEVNFMPLYFFYYETGEAEEIMDLKDYIINGIKGGADDFILNANSEEDEIDLRFVRNPV